MATLSQLDINTYLQLAGCCYSSMSVEYAKSLKYGKKCIEKDRINLTVLSVLMEILSCYRVGEDDNCYTEEEIQKLIHDIGELTGLCFKPVGYSYEVPEGYVLDEETGTISPE